MEHQEWLTINYSLPKEPSRVRVNVWRKLKKSGAAILGQSVWFARDQRKRSLPGEDLR